MRKDAAVLLLLAFAGGDAAAQSCLGFPESANGFAAYGFEGTDAASGEGFRIGVSGGEWALHLHRGKLDDAHTLPEGISFLRGEVAVRPAVDVRGVCLTGGLERTSYDASSVNVISWQTDPETGVTRRIETAIVRGDYSRTRYAAGIALGTTWQLDERIAVLPFAAPGLVYETERFIAADGELHSARGVLAGGRVGLGVLLGPVLLQGSVQHFFRGQDLSGRDVFPFLSLSLGWIFADRPAD